MRRHEQQGDVEHGMREIRVNQKIDDGDSGDC